MTKIEPVVRQSVDDGSHYFRSISRLFTRENLHKGPLSNSPMWGNVTLAVVDKVSQEANISKQYCHNCMNMNLTSAIGDYAATIFTRKFLVSSMTS